MELNKGVSRLTYVNQRQTWEPIMPHYERLRRQDTPPSDAVVVSLWHAAGRTVADVVCSEAKGGADLSVAEFPRPVSVALERAEEVRKVARLSKVVVVVDDRKLWRSEWGQLLEYA